MDTLTQEEMNEVGGGFGGFADSIFGGFAD